MTTTETNNTTTKSNRPSHEVFVVTDAQEWNRAHPEDKTVKAKWTRVGVAFPTKSGQSHRVLIGAKGDPKQRVYLVSPNSSQDDVDSRSDDASRRPYANVYDATNGPVDFRNNQGVAFVNRDGSLTLLIGERGDPDQLRYQMREMGQRGASKKRTT